MVVAGSDVGGQRAESIERRFVAFLDLSVHIFLDLVHGHVAGALDEHLHIVAPCDFGEFAEHVEFEELRAVVGVVYGAGAQSVAERHGHVIPGQNLAYLLEMGIEEILFVVDHGPPGHDGSSAAHNAGEAFGDHVGVRA